MDPFEFEAEARENVRRILRQLQSKEQFHQTPQLHRALEIEDEMYKRSNKCAGLPDSHDVWTNNLTCKLYKNFIDELLLNMDEEVGAYWRRVENGNISSKHLVDKFCKSATVFPKQTKTKAATKRKRPEEEAAAIDPSDPLQQDLLLAKKLKTSDDPAIEGNEIGEGEKKKKHKKEKKEKKKKKKKSKTSD